MHQQGPKAISDNDDEHECSATTNILLTGCEQRMGMGDMRVLYDDDLSANKLLMTTDEGEKVCNHVITMELTVAL